VSVNGRRLGVTAKSLGAPKARFVIVKSASLSHRWIRKQIQGHGLPWKFGQGSCEVRVCAKELGLPCQNKSCICIVWWLQLNMNIRWVKRKQDTLLMSITLRKIDWFSRFFTDRLRTKFSTKQILYSPRFLTDVAALLCETATFQKSYKFKNTLSKDVVLKCFCGCACLISFSRQITLSVKNYEISVHIKYSVRDLTYDIHICAWAAMMQ